MNVAVKLIGDVLVESAWPPAGVTVTPGAVASPATVALFETALAFPVGVLYGSGWQTHHDIARGGHAGRTHGVGAARDDRGDYGGVGSLRRWIRRRRCR